MLDNVSADTTKVTGVGVYQRHHQVGVPRQQRPQSASGVFRRLRNKSASALNTVVVFYREYTRVVIYISVGKEAV